jgi:dipeptidyl aminopeptidase/acylaminoacyl peptidase
MKVSAAGGKPEPATQLPGGGEVGTHRFPEFLPDGRHFVVYSSGGTGTEPGVLMLGEVGSTDTIELGPSSSRAVVAPPDQLIYVRGEALVAHHFDLDSQSLVGEPEVLGVSLPGSLQVSGYRSLSASSTGVLAFRQDIRGSTELTWVDRSGQELGKIAADREAWQYAPRLSPDGRRLVVARYENSPNVGDLWIHDLERGIADRVQLEEGDESMAAWSPDQQFIAFDAVRSSPTYGLYIMPVGRPGEERLLIETQSLVGFGCFTPDGRSIVYEHADEEGSYHLWIVDLDGDGQPSRLFPEPASQWSAALSPDGEWLAYASDVTGQSEIYVRRLDGTGAPIRVSSSGGGQPLWKRDGRELFYVSVEPELVAVPVTPGDPPQFGRPESLFPTRFEDTSDRQYDASLDGQRFVLNQPAATAVIPPIVVTSDWRRVLAEKSSRQ